MRQEIFEKYPPREVSDQIEFDRVMSEVNNEQMKRTHPLIDKVSAIEDKVHDIMVQRSALNIQLEMLRKEKASVERERKEINRVFHELKHEMIMLNPREKYAKQETELIK